jgi:hypothetical protein
MGLIFDRLLKWLHYNGKAEKGRVSVSIGQGIFKKLTEVSKFPLSINYLSIGQYRSIRERGIGPAERYSFSSWN